jgi:hypothetical protein
MRITMGNEVHGKNWRILKSDFSLRPFDDVPETAWRELTDPVSFVVSSLLLLVLGPRADAQKANRMGIRAGATIGVFFWLLAPALAGIVFPQISTGDPFAYAATLLVAGAFTFIPGRVAELRAQRRIPGTGYPKRLRKRMWWIETLLIYVTVGALIIWGIGAPDSHDVWRGIVWGVGVVCASEMSTLAAAKSVAIGDEDVSRSG